MTEIRPAQSGSFQSKDKDVICPKPQRPPQFVPSPELSKPSVRLRNTITHADGGEAGFEILDIFFSKGANLCCSPPYFCGSPPSRSDNPLIHDVQFAHQRVSPAPPFFLQHNSLCEPAHRFSPLVRVEGFITSGPESRCRVSARA